jgi:hypothetical protein
MRALPLPASRLRSVYRHQDQSEFRQYFEKILSARLGAVAINSLAAKEVEDESIQLKLNFDASRFGQFLQERLLVLTPGSLALGSDYLFAAKDRKTPVRLSPTLRRDTVALEIPEGFAVDEMPDPVHMKGPFGSYQACWRAEAGKVLMEQSVEIPEAEVPAADYPALRQFFDAIRRGGARTDPARVPPAARPEAGRHRHLVAEHAAAGAAARPGRPAGGQHLDAPGHPVGGGVHLAGEPHLVPHGGGPAPPPGRHGGHQDRPRRRPKRALIERAYTLGERLGLAVGTQDEAGPSQAVPQPGPSWQPAGQPARQHLEALGYNEMIEYRVSEAVQALRETEGPFDLIFNDINKHAYPESLEIISTRLRSCGVLIVDNLLWHGHIFDPSDKSPGRSRGG